MIFSSLLFLYIFLPLSLIVYYIAPKKMRNFILLIISLVFYGWGEPIYILLMIAAIIIEYLGAILIDKSREDKEKSTFIFVTVLVINLSMLFFFKYYGFLIDNINIIFGTSLRIKSLPLPLGISFYTFKLISYLVDVYRGKVKVQKNIINFGVYIAMFPQLLAGPIEQYSNIYEQIENRKETISKFGDGAEKFVIGLGKKVIIANNLAIVWTQVKSLQSNEMSVLTAWIGIIAFTLQIYFDFSGYSDMAIGLGRMMGFEFLENFDYPYISKSVTEFWRRWHISLGSWFRDYIYVPLGGNRCGTVVQIRNIFIVWFTTGLWHGASWNFIIWGLYFGVFIFIEKVFLHKILKRIPGIIANIYTMLLVVISWVFFDIETLKGALAYIGNMFGIGSNGLKDSLSMYIINTNWVFFVIALVGATPIVKNLITFLKERIQIPTIIIVVLFYSIIILISTAYLVNESYSPFLYFKF
ncbi:MBOAT family protein [Clostridium sp.]|uniref:MBOAT family O-acyltransferase n=1 Tax=Clostridium sp. TaxID=1506 RepID=UPI0026338BB8|nr:MBOAT family O-acyltransferase [Clostridium sp.]